ncbi:general transcription factor 3C polypeptide 3 [Cheilinus undulatus]|uniref:general transcription factor 3C polypeptide 3 n=1 Tax=Cheilinus undulatus TaxID=241271 RepID=UPI001BD3FE16|nr:general transcription factor 3C polypeptide 3 [Cheilinus undulatus]XP_041638222.1 general transcription factor 3C polypeptide 3 [Cheilinus undulatus]
MSAFSAELIDYLEGRITFEEFDKRRDERKPKDSAEDAEDDAQPSTSAQIPGNREEGVSAGVQLAFASMLGETPQPPSSDEEEGEEEEEEEEEEDSLSYVDDENDEDYKVREQEGEKTVVAELEDMAEKKQRQRGKGGRGRRKRKQEEEEEDQDVTVGDVFALEMELNRENKKMMKERRHRSKLPRALRGLMGEANIRYARGDKEDAILMCMEIIRQAPLAFEPFSTLAMIYEDNEDVEKALQFGLIAAHLNPSDCEEWIRLAEMSLEQDNIRQAIVCYSKAIKYDPTNVRYLWERSSLHMRLGEHRQCMDGYRRILSLLPMEDGEHFMQLSKDMAKSYYESNDLTAALGVIEDALSRHPDLVSDDFINMAAELYIANRQYNKALEVLVKFAGVVLVREESKPEASKATQEEEVAKKSTEEHKKKDEEGTESKPAEEAAAEDSEIKDVEVPDSVPVDLRAKLMVCLIHLHVLTPVEGLVSSLMEQSPEEIGDLYLDVGEAYLEEGEYMAALPLLSALVISEKYNLAVVWLRHAECLKALGHMEAAAESYTKVVEMAPQHLEARLSLATLQQQLGRPECALKALESMYDSDTLAQDSSAAQKELKLLLHRSTLLKTQGQTEGYLDAMISMISMLLKVAMQRAKVCVRSVIVSGESHLRLVKVNNVVPEFDDHEAAYLDNTGKTNVLSKEDWWQLLMSCVLTLCEVKRYEEAELLVESAMEFFSFYDNKPKRKELEFFGLSATILDRNYYKAYNYIRLMLMENVDLPQLWNIFNQLTITSQHQRHHRFCLRLLLKHPDNHALCVLCGHNAMVSGSFKHALGQYIQAFKTHPNDPLSSLCVGLTFFHMACQKYVAKRHTLVLQGFSFLWRYVELRGECQESMYNLGRALHQIGLTHLAIHYYQKALTIPAQKLEGIPDDQVDLSREIAFNLSLIYQSSGNMEMARQLIKTHCII